MDTYRACRLLSEETCCDHSAGFSLPKLAPFPYFFLAVESQLSQPVGHFPVPFTTEPVFENPGRLLPLEIIPRCNPHSAIEGGCYKATPSLCQNCHIPPINTSFTRKLNLPVSLPHTRVKAMISWWLSVLSTGFFEAPYWLCSWISDSFALWPSLDCAKYANKHGIAGQSQNMWIGPRCHISVRRFGQGEIKGMLWPGEVSASWMKTAQESFAVVTFAQHFLNPLHIHGEITHSPEGYVSVYSVFKKVYTVYFNEL